MIPRQILRQVLRQVDLTQASFLRIFPTVADDFSIIANAREAA